MSRAIGPACRESLGRTGTVPPASPAPPPARAFALARPDGRPACLLWKIRTEPESPPDQGRPDPRTRGPARASRIRGYAHEEACMSA